MCIVQALLANIAAMYGIYHGPSGLRTIATRTHNLACLLAAGAEKLGHSVSRDAPFFDTVCISPSNGDAVAVCKKATTFRINFRKLDKTRLTISLDETTTVEDVNDILKVLNDGKATGFLVEELAPYLESNIGGFARTSPFMQNEVFNAMNSEHDLLRYLKTLENRDLSLVHSMIPLGSCTMKLNATSEMIPVSWPELANLHPFAPKGQTLGYQEMFNALSQQLCEITAFDSVSLQPNSGASGEYAGLMAIRAYHKVWAPSTSSNILCHSCLL
jgi:glycine dehydrogenase